MKFSKGLAPVLAVTALLVTGCTSTSSSTSASAAPATSTACASPILIGAAMAQTGFMAPFDAPALATAKIAVDKINKAGGVNGCQLELQAVDTQTNPDKGQQIATNCFW
jgi:branched-chain amino acid transport system substrate-binding protein